jgi:hypothetical protein
MPLNPIDPNSPIPPGVKAQATRAEQLHAAAYQTPAPNKEDIQPITPVVSPQPDPTPVVVSPQPNLTPAPAPTGDEELDDGATAAQWKHRYLSMQGRFQAAQRTIGSQQEQISEIGDELIKVQQLNTQLLQGGNRAPGAPAKAGQRLVSDDEVANYGADLIDVVKRAAQEQIAPELEAVKAENNDLKRKMQRTTQQGVVASLAQAVPEWEKINVDPAFVAWLRLPDIYSGRVRQQMLNQAFAAADAARVIAFFNGYLDEAAATGNAPSPTPQPAAASAPAPRAPVVPLATLAAPGRAKPASGDQTGQAPVDKPVFSHAQIKAFYNDVRRGVFVGREAEKAKLEQQIFAAQTDGRIR